MESTPPDVPKTDHFWLGLSVFGCLLLTLTYQPLGSMYTKLLANALLVPTSLYHDLLVQGALSPTLYTLAPRWIAPVCARVGGASGKSPENILSVLLLSLWILQAVLTFRCFHALLGEVHAACLATVLTGLPLEIFISDYPYSLEWLERTLGMIPLVWGMKALFEDRPWAALAGLWAAMYLHPHPAMYVLPFFVLADWLKALENPSRRGAACARLAVSALLSIPYILTVKSSSLPQTDLEFARLTIVHSAHQLAGIGTPASDWIFRLESLALAAVAAWHTRHRACTRYLILALVVCAAFLAAGRIAYRAWHPGAHIAEMILRMGPMNALFLPDFFGLPLLSLWITRLMKEKNGAWPVLLLILALSWTHDFVLRLFAIGLGLCALRGMRTTALLVAALAALLPWSYVLAPNLFHSVVHAVGLRGGLFELPAFKPVAGALILALAAAGYYLQKSASSIQAAFLAAGILLLIGAHRLHERKFSERTAAAFERMADWIRDNTPPDSVIVASPPYLIPTCIDFMSESRRSLFACSDVLDGATTFGAAAKPMADRLRDMGYDLSRQAIPYEGANYLSRQKIPNLTSPQAGALLKKIGATGYLLTSRDTGASEGILHQEGPLAVYAAP